MLSFRSFLLALGFLSRLGPALPASRAEISLACFWFPVVGGILGLVAALCSWSVHCLSSSALAAGWTYALLLAWLTRALHLDGLADLADGLGSGKTGQPFWDVLKDSRIGVFGAVGVCFILSGQVIFSMLCLERGNYMVLAFAPALGRSLPMLLAAFSSPHSDTGLGSLLEEGPPFYSHLLCLACIIAGSFLFLDPAPAIAVCLGCIALLFFFVRLAIREEGYNGDFLGGLILSGELLVLLASVF